MKARFSITSVISDKIQYSATIIFTILSFIGAVYIYWTFAGFHNSANSLEVNQPQYSKWKNAQIEHYSFLLDSSCPNHNAQNLRIEVREGKRVWPRANNYPTIDQLFQTIEVARQSADYYKAYYHPIGFPRYASINWTSNVYDDGCGFIVSQFKVLSGSGPIPSVLQKRRIREPRFSPPEFSYGGISNSLGEIWTKEEREQWAKQHVLPESILEDSF